MSATPIALDQVLACPRCHAPLHHRDDAVTCALASCGFRAPVSQGVVHLVGDGRPTFFDANVETMVDWTEQPGIWELCYAQQMPLLRRLLADARTILDVGCGPRLLYERPPGSVLIGIEVSFESIVRNPKLDVRLHGSATNLPLPSGSVDAVLCLYALHHIIGETVDEHEHRVREALGEFARVLRAGGDLLVFEVSPWRPAWLVQRLVWNTARRVLGQPLDMFFWARGPLERLAGRALPAGTTLTYHEFRVPWLMTFPPVFSHPRLRIPRALYPFHVCLYHWRMGT